MHSRLITLLASGAVLASVTGGPAAVALASPAHHPTRAHHTRVHRALGARTAPATRNGADGTEPASREADNDAAAQAAACQRAGVTSQNVNYDGSTCTVDTGGSGSQQQG